MKYRVKLSIALIGIAFLASISAILPIYFKAKATVFKELSSTALTLAASVSLQVPAEKLKELSFTKDMSSNEYIFIRNILDKERNIQRKHGLFIEDVTIIQPLKNHSSKVMVLVDAPVKLENTIKTGKIYEESDLSNQKISLKKLFSPNGFIQDDYGIWLIGYAPIFDEENQYVATVLVSIKASRIHEEIRQILVYGVISWLIATILSLMAAGLLSRRLTCSLQQLREKVFLIKQGDLESPISLSTQDEFQELAVSIEEMRLGLQEREKLKSSFSKYVSHHVMETILKEKSSISLKGESKKITVLFCDIRGFTKLAEKETPEGIVAILNEYFQYMLEEIFSHKGTLDKFIGDGIMVEFGSPLDDVDQEKNAVDCALAMHARLNKLNEKWKKEGKPRVSIGIGIHTGMAIVGNIGTEKRMEYTAIGDTVNVAARMEKKTKDFEVPILISEATKMGLNNQDLWKDLGLVSLEGRRKEIRIFTLKSLKHEKNL